MKHFLRTLAVFATSSAFMFPIAFPVADQCVGDATCVYAVSTPENERAPKAVKLAKAGYTGVLADYIRLYVYYPTLR
jgi:hypothetical protein